MGSSLWMLALIHGPLAGLATVPSSNCAEFSASAHDNSVSYSRVEVRGSGLDRIILLQTASILEVVPGADLNLDGLLQEDELVEPAVSTIAAYVHQHYQLEGGIDGQRDVLIPGEPNLAVQPGGLPGEWVLLITHYESASGTVLEAVDLTMDLFARTSPDHMDHGALSWEGRGPVGFRTGPGVRDYRYSPPSFVSALADGFARARDRFRARWELAALCLLIGLVVGPTTGLRAGQRSPAVAVLAGVGLGWCSVAVGIAPLPEVVLNLACPLGLVYLRVESLLRRARDGPSNAEPLAFGILSGVALDPLSHQEVGALPGALPALLGEATAVIGVSCALVVGGIWVGSRSGRLGTWLAHGLALAGVALFLQRAFLSS